MGNPSPLELGIRQSGPGDEKLAESDAGDEPKLHVSGTYPTTV